MTRSLRSRRRDVAIIGMSGRFPGAGDLASFWRNLREGVESISFFSDEELVGEGVLPSLIGDPNYVKAGGVLDGVDLFDASFFGYSPREAESLDPQHRVFLEESWHALEDAGYDPETYPGVIGIYAGSSMSTYLGLILRNPDFIRLVSFFQVLIGNDKDYVTSRVSYKLNLKGPSVAVQTACSTSLVAVAQGYDALLNHHCDIALTGGVTIRVPHRVGYYHTPGGIYSPDGHCRAFDQEANGTVFGNGVGLVVLKRLQDALADGDTIRAVIKGVAVNNDGAAKVGYTAPSLQGQTAVIRSAYSSAGIDTDTVTFVETHGTGTALGDPIEIAALTQAFRATSLRTGFCAIGSVKSNIGHLDATAGVASLIKVVMALENGLIPPTLHIHKVNQQLDIASTPFYVIDRPAEWRTGGLPKRAGVSAFGIGGTNAHVVLEEAPALATTRSRWPRQLFLLSARTASALDSATDNLADHLVRQPGQPIADIAYTTQVGRRAFGYRRTVIAGTLKEATDALRTRDPRASVTAREMARDRSVAFMFPGQGSQYPAMAADIYRMDAGFRRDVEQCAGVLEPLLRVDLLALLYPKGGRAASAERALYQTQIAQSALFVVEYALARLLMRWGIQPEAMIGHSIGEYVAACLAGVIGIDEALGLVARRGQLMQALPPGSMLTVPLSEEELKARMNETLSVAAINEPRMSVVSGPSAAVESLANELARAGVACHRLHTSHAFHSTMMDPILDAFTALTKSVDLHAPHIPYVSNVTGNWITKEEATDPSYWSMHIRKSVRFAAGIRALLHDPDRIFLEVGPGLTLSAFVRRHPERRPDQVAVSTVPHVLDRKNGRDVILDALGQLWLSGVRVDWTAVHAGDKRRRVPIPTYPFERRRFWVASDSATDRTAKASPLREKRSDPSSWLWVPAWKKTAPASLAEPPRRSRWLLFGNKGLSDDLACQLAILGQDVVRVRIGSRFRKFDSSYEIDPNERADYTALIEDLRGRQGVPQRILHLWNAEVTRSAKSADRWKQLDRIQSLGLYSLLFLAQALGDERDDWPLDVTAVSTGLHRVTGREDLQPERATVLGPCRVIPQELPSVGCRSIDVPVTAPRTAERDQLVRQLIAECSTGSSDAVVALRDGGRWVRIFEPLPTETPSGTPSRLREGGSYVITGGLGGIGLALARFLAETVHASLTLVNRSSFPKPSQWNVWLAAHDAGEPVARRIRVLREIERLGGQVLITAADVAEPAQIRAVIDQTRSKFGKINGVIHAAGLPGAGIVALKSKESGDTVLAPKVRGTLALETALEGEDLDFLMLCSSLTGILGGVGQVDYAAANAFLDAFATSRFGRRGHVVIALAWDTWQEVGMAVDTPVPPALEASRREALRLGITTEQAMQVFTRALSTSAPHIAVSATDLLSLVSHAGRPSPEKSVPDAIEPGSTMDTLSVHPRPDLTHPYAPPETRTERTIAGIFQQLLGITQAGRHDDFFTELGGHSLLATQVVSRLRAVFDVGLPLRLIFEASTVAQLATAVDAARADGKRSDVGSPVVPVARRERRGMISKAGELEVSEELRETLST